MATGGRSTSGTRAIVLALLLLCFAATRVQSQRKPSARYISYAARGSRPDCVRAGRPVFCLGVSVISGKPAPRCACHDPAPPRLDAETAADLHEDP